MGISARGIAGIPVTELLKDRDDAVRDIGVCVIALRVGLNEERDGLPITTRIKSCADHVSAIDAELARRGLNFVGNPIYVTGG